MKLGVKKLSDNAIIPKYQTSGSSGFDLHALNDTIVYPNGTSLVSTGLSFEIPEGYELQIRPRSGMSSRTKLRVANAPGTIDSDFKGHVQIILDNISNNAAEAYTVKAGERIAQAILSKVEQAEIEEVLELTESERGTDGIGSTKGFDGN